MKTIEIVHCVEIKIFYFLVEIFKIETFELRLGCIEIFIEIVNINRDCQDLLRLSRLFENCQLSRYFGFKTSVEGGGGSPR